MTPHDVDRLDELVDAARDVRELAYAPYSNFSVGAAILAGDRVFAGANVENASYGVAICAERSAVVQMVASGERTIDAVVVVAAGDGGVVSPCGACRQVLAEFGAPDVPVVGEHVDGRRKTWTIGELLPAAFSLSHEADTAR